MIPFSTSKIQNFKIEDTILDIEVKMHGFMSFCSALAVVVRSELASSVKVTSDRRVPGTLRNTFSNLGLRHSDTNGIVLH